MNNITMTLQADHLILEALKEDISSEDVSTNAVMREAVPGEVDLICKQDGVIAGLEVFEEFLNCWTEKQRRNFTAKTRHCKIGTADGAESGAISVCFCQENGRRLIISSV